MSTIVFSVFISQIDFLFCLFFVQVLYSYAAFRNRSRYGLNILYLFKCMICSHYCISHFNHMYLHLYDQLDTPIPSLKISTLLCSTSRHDPFPRICYILISIKLSKFMDQKFSFNCQSPPKSLLLLRLNVLILVCFFCFPQKTLL